MFVIILKYISTFDKLDKFAPEHFRYLDKYFDENVFLVAGRQNPRVGGVIIAMGKSKEQITAIVEEDPFVRESIADFEIIEFEPGRHHMSLDGLLANIQ